MITNNLNKMKSGVNRFDIIQYVEIAIDIFCLSKPREDSPRGISSLIMHVLPISHLYFASSYQHRMYSAHGASFTNTV